MIVLGRKNRDHVLPILFLIVSSLLIHPSVSAQNSILATGDWHKLAVEKDGVYEIGYDQLVAMGIQPSRISPNLVRLFSMPTGMLPQANSAPRPSGLTEIRIYVTGSNDGRFDRKDKIIFFGQGPDRIGYDRARDFHVYENNLFSERNYYFLTVNNGFGARTTRLSTATTGEIITTWRDLYLYDADRVNLLRSGREWFGQDFDANTRYSLEWTMENTIADSPVRIATRLEATAYDPATFQIKYNSQDLGTFPLAAVPATSYGLKGRTRSDTMATRSTTGNRHTIDFEYIRGGNNYSIGRLDQVLASIPRKLAFNGKSFLFFNTDGTNAESMLEIAANIPTVVWDITDPHQVKSQDIITFGNSFRFTTDGRGAIVRRYAVFDSAITQQKPTYIGRVSNRDLRAPSTADFVIITHPDFHQEALRLAQHRTDHDGLSVLVATTDDIYNEFSGGRQDVSAIRDFIRHVYLSGGRQLQHALLFGKGSYDYRDLTPGNKNFVPVYESRNSLSPLETYSSDDFYAFLEDHEGNWGESPPEFHSLDIGIGRIPCSSPAEAAAAVDKLIAYDMDNRQRGSWRKEITFVADDGDNNIHQSQAEALAQSIESASPELHINRLYLDDFRQEIKPFGQLSPDGTEALQRAIQEGSAIINYTGHGSEQLWTAERMLSPEVIGQLDNRNRLPFLVTATCEFGRADDPANQSSGEKLVLQTKSGAIGMVTTSRPVNSATNFQLNQDFYNALFSRGLHTQYLRMGSVFKATKNARNSGIANRNFSLLGDPSMRIGLPQASVALANLTNSNGDSEIQGLDEITLSGEIRQGPDVWNSWNGTVQIELFNQPESKTTKGDENPPFAYTTWSGLLWKGTASVVNGVFQVSFRLPGSLTQIPTDGKLIFHATSTSGHPDAGGAAYPVRISTEEKIISDNNPPAAILYANDTTFQDGGTVGPNPVIGAVLTDDFGLDLTGLPGREISITVDGESVFYASDRTIQSLLDDSVTPTYNMRFQLFGLTDGQHEVVLQAFDLAGNKTESAMHFVVNQDDLNAYELNGYPNPFSATTSIRFRHTVPGEDLEGSIRISSTAGNIIRTLDFAIDQSNTQTEIMTWDGTDTDGNKIPPGLYILTADVRSVRKGVKKRLHGRLILLN